MQLRIWRPDSATGCERRVSPCAEVKLSRNTSTAILAGHTTTSAGQTSNFTPLTLPRLPRRRAPDTHIRKYQYLCIITYSPPHGPLCFVLSAGDRSISWHKSVNSLLVVSVVSAGTVASFILARNPLLASATTPSEIPVKQVRLPAEIRPLPCVSRCGVEAGVDSD